MKNKDQTIYSLVALAVIIIVGIWLFKSQKASQNNSGQNNTPNEQTSKPPANNSSTAQGQNVWVGTLRLSDNPAKGNLMLTAEDHNLYLRTSRDFSALVGKKVKVSYSGSLDKFTLLDITAE